MKNGYFIVDGKKKFMVGINYLPSSFGHSGKFWEQPDWDEVKTDFSVIASIKIDAVRLPLPFTLALPDRSVDKKKLRIFDRIVEIAGKNKLLLMPNFFHTGTDNIQGKSKGKKEDMVFPSNNDYYTSDDCMIILLKVIKSIIEKYRDDKIILAWDISNEPWWFVGRPTSLADGTLPYEVVDKWLERLCKGVREMNPSQPITFGADPPCIITDWGGTMEKITSLTDFTSTHFYNRYIDSIAEEGINTLRDTYYSLFISKFGQYKGKGFCSAESGTSTYLAGEEEQQKNIRISLYSLLINGACGFFPWTYIDFKPSAMRGRYRTDPQELAFGIVRANGSLKPAAEEIRNFSSLIGGIDLEKFWLPRAQAGILVTDLYYHIIERHWKSYLQCTISARSAGVNVDFVRSDENLRRYRLLYIPSGIMRIEVMNQLREYVKEGGNLYLSLDKMIHATCGGYLQELFGYKLHDIVAVYPDLRIKGWKYFPQLQGSWSFPDPLARIGTLYRFRVKPDKGSKVLLEYEDGYPAFVKSNFGKGSVLCATFPVEYLLTIAPHTWQSFPLHEVYNLAAKNAGIEEEVSGNNPYIETGIFRNKNNKRILILVNHDCREQTVSLTFKRPASHLAAKDKGEDASASERITLEASGVRVYTVE